MHLARRAAIQSRLEAELLLPVDLSFVDARRGMTRFQTLAAAMAIGRRHALVSRRRGNSAAADGRRTDAA